MADAIIIRAPLPLSRDFIDYPYFTFLGTCQAAAVLEQAGWRVRILDGLTAAGADLTERDDGFWLGLDPDSFLESVENIDASLALIHLDSFLRTGQGLSWLDRMVRSLGRAKVEKRVLVEMVTGGMHELQLDGQELLDRFDPIDLVLRFEGERMLKRLADGFSRGREIWEETTAFPLDDLPKPAFGMLDLESTFHFLQRVLESSSRPGPFPAAPGRTLPLVTARGCPYGCVFCSGRPGLGEAGRRVRSVPWERVRGWLKRWRAEFGLERIVFLDDVANLDRSRFEAMLTTLEELHLRTEFPNGLRADLLVYEDIRRLAGLTSGLKVSLESASRRVQQEVLRKNLDPAAVERVAGWCRQEGVPLQVHCLVGMPGETREEINQTLKMAARLADRHGVEPLVQFAVPLPGTPLDGICREGGFLQEDPPEDWHSCFLRRPIIETPEFDRGFLLRALASLQRVVSPTPDHKVIVNLTYRCNNHCVFCAVGDRARRDADTGEVVAALERYHQSGFTLLDIDGGEPTLHPDLFEVIQAGRRMGYARISVVTNGRRLSYANYARQLADSGIDEVLVSLHAPDAAGQASITGVPDSHQQTVQGLANILEELGSGNVAVNTTLVRTNLDHASRLADFLAEMGVRRWNLQVVTPFGRASSEQVPDPERLSAVLGWLLDSPPAGMKIQVINCPPCLLPGHEESASADFQKAARDMVFVGEEGENLQAFLSSRREQDRRCQDCPYAVLCPGHYLFERKDQ